LADITEAGPHGLRLDDFAERTSGVRFERDIKPWAIPCDVALPCATQNELGADDARALVNRGDVIAVAEGANMPCTEAAIETLRTANVMHLPGKAANAGGVLVSGLEMAQNAQRVPWDAERVDTELAERMQAIHDRCVENSSRQNPVDYAEGANVAAFRRLARAKAAQGWG
ncbi:MAG: glutamate dehydrogenase, partial [Myxococcota bacterium]